MDNKTILAQHELTANRANVSLAPSWKRITKDGKVVAQIPARTLFGKIQKPTARRRVVKLIVDISAVM